MTIETKPKPYTADEREAYLAEEAKKLVPGDRIEFHRMVTPMPVDAFEPDDVVEYAWDAATVLELVPPASAGNVVVKVRYDDGRTEHVESLARR